MKVKKLSFIKTLLLNLRKSRFIKHYAKRYLHKQLAEQFFEQLWQSAFAAERIYVSPKRIAADLPIALVVGAAQTGKTALLSASRQILPQSSSLNTDYQPIAGRPMPRHFLTAHKLFIELPQYFLINESAKQVPYLEQLLFFWQDAGYLSRIQQLVLTISLSNLLDDSSDAKAKREELLSSVSLLISRLAKPVQISLVVTEIDRLQGFVEFFADVGVEERQHPFGFALHAQGVLTDQIHQQFFMLHKRLQQRMWWRCRSEHVLAKRLLVAEFPKQLNKICTPLIEYLKPLQDAIKENPFAQVKACFFTSTMQRGNTFDLLFDFPNSISLQAEQNSLPMLLQNKEYFVRGFFQHLSAPVSYLYKPTKIEMPVATGEARKWLWPVVAGGLAIIGLTVLFFAAVFAWSWNHLHTTLKQDHVLAYKILSSRYQQQNIHTLVTYDAPMLPASLQNVIAESETLQNWLEAGARAYLEQRWQVEVYQPYQKNIAGKYPVDTSAKAEMSLDQFNAFYAPNGILAKFDQTYLQNDAIQKLFVSDQNLINLYAKVKRLQQVVYAANPALQLSFTIYPNTLADDVKAVTLMVSGKKMSLRRDGLIAGTFTWPNDQLDTESGFAIESAQALPQLQVFTGQWSWLRLFSIMHWQRADSENDYIMTSPNNQFSVQVNSNLPVAELPSLLTNLTIPNTL